MGNPYIKPAPPPGYNANPPSDDNAQTTENQVTWQKHLDKLGDPLNTHTTGEADATENAFAVRLLNGVIRTAATYSVVNANRGKVVEGTADGIIINLPDVTAPEIGIGWEIGVKALIASGGSITVKPSGTQTIDGVTELVILSGDFSLLSSDGANWSSLSSTAGAPAATQTEMQTATANDKMVTPLNAKWSPYASNSRVTFDAAGNIIEQVNVTSVVKNPVPTQGSYTITFTNAYATDGYSFSIECVQAGVTTDGTSTGTSATSITVQYYNIQTGNAADPARGSVMISGTLAPPP